MQEVRERVERERQAFGESVRERTPCRFVSDRAELNEHSETVTVSAEVTDTIGWE